MVKKTHKKIADEALLFIINSVGGQQALADKLNVSQSCVSRWLTTDMLVPAKHWKKLLKLSDKKIKMKDLRPDLFG